MNRFRSAAALVAALAAACGGDGPTDPPVPTVVSVTVTPTSATLPAVGASVQFQAQAKDASGAAVSGQTVTWSSSNTAIATISATGLATAVAPGTAAVTATVAGVAGSAVVTVSQSSCPDATTVSLSSGQSKIFAGSECVILPSGSSGDLYRVAVLRPTEAAVASDAPTATLRVIGLGVAQAPEPAAPAARTAPGVDIPGLSRAAVAQELRRAEATERFHAELREREAEMLRAMAPRGIRLAPDPGLARVVARAASPAKVQFDVSTSDCTTSADKKRTALLIHENDDLAVYQDSTQNATKPLGVGLAQRLTSYFTSYVKDMIPKYWGEPSDIDGNGKIILFATPVVSGDIAAFVWSGDFLTPESCPASNEREMMYFNTDYIMEIDSAQYGALETVAHETKHIVSLRHRIAASINAGNTNQFHPTWIEEGTAEIAGELSSRIAWAATGGPAVHAPISRQSFVNTGSITAENYGVAIKLARTVWYLSSQPNGLVVTPDGAADGSSVYGSGWLFHRWLGDVYGKAATGPMAEAPFFKELTDSLTARGTAGIFAKTGKQYVELYHEFAAAIALHATGAPEGSQPFSTYEFVTGAEIFCSPNPVGIFPWPVTTTGTAGNCETNVQESSVATVSFKTADYAGRIGASGMRFHDFLSNGTGTGAQLQLDLSSPAELLVVRIR